MLTIDGASITLFCFYKIVMLIYCRGDDVDFTTNLKKLLQERNMRQAELCRITKIPSSLMSDYMQGKKALLFQTQLQ